MNVIHPSLDGPKSLVERTKRFGSTGATATRPMRPFAIAAALCAAFVLSVPARAADGCLVLLCLAAPSWNNIAPCVDPVRQVLRDLAHGHPFPRCDMAGAGTAATSQSSRAPDYCPVQYTRAVSVEGATYYDCDYAGAIEVQVDGALWSRVWWSPSGESVTEYLPASRARLGTWDTRFDDDYATWAALQPPPVPESTGG
jgi:hypothetical protein